MSKPKPLYYYGGDGWGGIKEIGVFEVKATETKIFTKMSEARKCYESLHEEKACWDITRGAELIKAHTFSEPSETMELPF